MKRLLIPALFALSACATDNVKPEPVVVTKEVKVPVAVACPDKRNPPPDFIDSLETIQRDLGLGSDKLVADLLAGREQRIQYQAESDAQIASCARKPDG